MGRQEAAVEQHLVKEVRKRGGICVKVQSATRGVPDRLVITAAGVIKMVEVKTDEGRLDAMQVYWVSQAQQLGAPVDVVWGKAGVDAWVERELA